MWGRRVREDRPEGGAIFAESELFIRDLCEVHLLMDFISGRADKSLAGLDGVPGAGAGKGSHPTAQQLVEEICKITYPPQGGLAAEAHQAAFILAAKDRLNFLAHPARGLTIAFTAMVAGTAGPVPRRSRTWNRLRRILRMDREGPLPTARPRPGAGFFSANRAFPNLEPSARRFGLFWRWLPRTAMILILLIVYVNWDVSVAGSTLTRLSQAEKAYRDAAAACIAPSTAATGLAASAAAGPATSRPTGSTGPRAPKAATTALGPATPCMDYLAAVWPLYTGRQNLAALTTLGALPRPVAISVWLLDGERPSGLLTVPASPGSQRLSELSQPTRLESLTADVLTGLNTIIIPSMFGLLGTMAGLMRSINIKVRESTLAPRDSISVWVSLALGLCAGLAVGLFLSGVGGGGDAATGSTAAQTPMRTITISAAGLAFLAGFGADAFFGFLDGLLTRIFGAAVAASPTPAPPRLSR